MCIIQSDGSIIIINMYDCKNEYIYYTKIYNIISQMTK